MAGLHHKRWKTKSGQPRSGWYVTWYEPVRGGKPKRRWELYTGKGAQARAGRRKRELESVQLPEDAHTVETAGKAWADHIEAIGRARSTWDGYRRHLAQHINPALIVRVGSDEGLTERFGDIKLAQLTGPDCDALMRSLVDSAGIDMAAVLMRDLRMLIKDAGRRGWIVGNPAATVGVARNDRGADQVVIPEKDEIRALLTAIHTEPPAPPTFAEVWCRSTMITGMRPGENRGAAIEDLVLDGRKPGIHVPSRSRRLEHVGPGQDG